MITLFKEVKKGLPGFSNVTASVTITADSDKDLSLLWSLANEEIEKQLQVVPPGMLLKPSKPEEDNKIPF